MSISKLSFLKGYLTSNLGTQNYNLTATPFNYIENNISSLNINDLDSLNNFTDDYIFNNLLFNNYNTGNNIDNLNTFILNTQNKQFNYLNFYNLEDVKFYDKDFNITQSINAIDYDISSYASERIKKIFFYLDFLNKLYSKCYNKNKSDIITLFNGLFNIKIRYKHYSNNTILLSRNGLNVDIRISIKDNNLDTSDTNFLKATSSDTSIATNDEINVLLNYWKDDIIKHLNYILSNSDSIYFNNFSNFFHLSRLVLNNILLLSYNKLIEDLKNTNYKLIPIIYEDRLYFYRPNHTSLTSLSGLSIYKGSDYTLINTATSLTGLSLIQQYDTNINIGVSTNTILTNNSIYVYKTEGYYPEGINISSITSIKVKKNDSRDTNMEWIKSIELSNIKSNTEIHFYLNNISTYVENDTSNNRNINISDSQLNYIEIYWNNAYKLFRIIIKDKPNNNSDVTINLNNQNKLYILKDSINNTTINSNKKYCAILRTTPDSIVDKITFSSDTSNNIKNGVFITITNLDQASLINNIVYEGQIYRSDTTDLNGFEIEKIQNNNLLSICKNINRLSSQNITLSRNAGGSSINLNNLDKITVNNTYLFNTNQSRVHDNFKNSLIIPESEYTNTNKEIINNMYDLYDINKSIDKDTITIKKNKENRNNESNKVASLNISEIISIVLFVLSVLVAIYLLVEKNNIALASGFFVIVLIVYIVFMVLIYYKYKDSHERFISSTGSDDISSYITDVIRIIEQNLNKQKTTSSQEILSKAIKKEKGFYKDRKDLYSNVYNPRSYTDLQIERRVRKKKTALLMFFIELSLLIATLSLLYTVAPEFIAFIVIIGTLIFLFILFKLYIGLENVVHTKSNNYYWTKPETLLKDLN